VKIKVDLQDAAPHDGGVNAVSSINDMQFITGGDDKMLVHWRLSEGNGAEVRVSFCCFMVKSAQSNLFLFKFYLDILVYSEAYVSHSIYSGFFADRHTFLWGRRQEAHSVVNHKGNPNFRKNLPFQDLVGRRKPRGRKLAAYLVGFPLSFLFFFISFFLSFFSSYSREIKFNQSQHKPVACHLLVNNSASLMQEHHGQSKTLAGLRLRFF